MNSDTISYIEPEQLATGMTVRLEVPFGFVDKVWGACNGEKFTVEKVEWPYGWLRFLDGQTTIKFNLHRYDFIQVQ